MTRIRLWVGAIRDSFVTLLPLTMLSVLCLLIRDFPLSLYQVMMSGWLGANWQASVSVLIDATQGFFGLTLCLIVSIEVAKRLALEHAVPPLFIALSAMTNFMVCMITIDPHVSSTFSKTAAFIGFAVGIVSTELLHALQKRGLNKIVRLPYDTDSTFYHALSLTIPTIVSCVIFYAGTQGILALIGKGVGALSFGGLAESQDPWVVMLLATAINQLVWFVGLHGGYALDSVSGILLPVLGGLVGELDWRVLFNNFVLLGGAGATLGLLIAIKLVVKEGMIKHVGRISILPGVFNINETLLYGLPVLLNRAFLLPFFLVPFALALLTLLAVSSGWLVVVPHVVIPWTTPPLISGWLVTQSWHGLAFQLLELLISTAIYMPFVRAADTQRQARQQAAFTHAIEVILDNGGNARTPVCARNDGVGLIARGLLDDLRADFERGKLFLAFQPKHHLSGQLVGFEALMRWTHTKYGPLSPSVAISLAEESGDIHALGAWVIDQACASKAAWNASNSSALALTLSVNVSPIQLENMLLVDALSAALHKHQLAPGEMELEVTETQRLSESPEVVATLEAITVTGVKLAIDDFGMGHSSLLYLRRFNVSAIKIDGSLTRDVLSDPMGAEIVRTIVALGNARDVTVVAEFVETKEQQSKLASLGCQCFQGYFYSAPMNQAVTLAYIESNCLAAGEAK